MNSSLTSASNISKNPSTTHSFYNKKPAQFRQGPTLLSSAMFAQEHMKEAGRNAELSKSMANISRHKL